MLCRFFCNIRLLWFPGKKSCIIKVKDKELKIHRYWLPGRLLCSIRSNRKWCKRRGSSLECQNCFFVYPIIDSNLTNLVNCVDNQNKSVLNNYAGLEDLLSFLLLLCSDKINGISGQIFNLDSRI